MISPAPLLLLAACTGPKEVPDYTVSDGQIHHNGVEIQLHGVNWFGFEGSEHVVHGLWTRTIDDMIAQMKGLGFNAVRLPFCPETLDGVTPGAVDYSINPNLEGLDSLDLLDLTVQKLNDREMYMLLDHHSPDCEEISELWYTGAYSEEDWINDLTFVANRYGGLGYFLGIDLKNEPHGAATWGTGDESTDWNSAVERASEAVLSANPGILVFAEGIQENPECSSTDNAHWWGGNLEPQACNPLAIPSNKLVLSPHVYGPDVYDMSYFDEANFPENMDAIWNTQFGFAADNGYVVAPGEFGGMYGEGNPLDVTWQNTLVDYFMEKGICNFFYWSWNPNSGDTGGILDDDWTTVEEGKYENLKRLMDACNAD
ncbi:MAG: glycoside hydrolase family 5 protein [Deltaproteobacteria bacterium]|nr:glycoside hydrolase family 5 protein [Deltaproteobacteria bacterium]